MKYRYKVGNQVVELVADNDRVAVRFKEPALHSVRAASAEKCSLGSFRERIEVPMEKFTILPVVQEAKARGKRLKKALDALGKNKQVSRVGMVFKRNDTTVIATDRILAGFSLGGVKVMGS